MNAFLSGLFADHLGAQRAIAELRRALDEGTHIGALLRRDTRSTITTGTDMREDDAALLAPLGATYVSDNGRFLVGGALVERMRGTSGDVAQTLSELGMPPEEVRESLRRVEAGEILVLVTGITQEAPIRQVLIAAGATNLNDAPVRSQIRRNPMDMPRTVEPSRASEGPSAETTSLHRAKTNSAHRTADENRNRAAARDEEIAGIQTDESSDNPSAPPD